MTIEYGWKAIIGSWWNLSFQSGDVIYVMLGYLRAYLDKVDQEFSFDLISEILQDSEREWERLRNCHTENIHSSNFMSFDKRECRKRLIVNFS